MKIIQQFNTTRELSDCVADEELAFIETMHGYSILHITTYKGLEGFINKVQTYDFTDYCAAIQKYEKLKRSFEK